MQNFQGSIQNQFGVSYSLSHQEYKIVEYKLEEEIFYLEG